MCYLFSCKHVLLHWTIFSHIIALTIIIIALAITVVLEVVKSFDQDSLFYIVTVINIVNEKQFI